MAVGSEITMRGAQVLGVRARGGPDAAPPICHCSFVYTADDRRRAIPLVSRLSAAVGVLQALEGVLALGLIAEVWVRGLSAKADVGFLLACMFACAALLLY